MKQRRFILFLLLACLSLGNIQAEDDILLTEIDPHSTHGGRSLQAVPTAILNGTELNLQYPFATESQVVIVDQSTQTTVSSAPFTASRSVVIDLEDEGLGEGTYSLHVYAFGKWWWGEFVLEEND